MKRGVLLARGGAVLWLMAVGVGVGALWSYASTAGSAAQPPPSWPPTSRLVRASGRPTLVMLVHPRCPCSRASLDELARVMVVARDRLSVHVLFLRPSGTDDA